MVRQFPAWDVRDGVSITLGPLRPNFVRLAPAEDSRRPAGMRAADVHDPTPLLLVEGRGRAGSLVGIPRLIRAVSLRISRLARIALLYDHDVLGIG